MYLGDPVSIFADFGIERELNPSELLKRCISRREIPKAIHGHRRRLIAIGEVQSISQRQEGVASRALLFDREANKIGLRIVDVHSDQDHPLTAPELHTEAI